MLSILRFWWLIGKRYFRLAGEAAAFGVQGQLVRRAAFPLGGLDRILLSLGSPLEGLEGLFKSGFDLGREGVVGGLGRQAGGFGLCEFKPGPIGDSRSAWCWERIGSLETSAENEDEKDGSFHKTVLGLGLGLGRCADPASPRRAGCACVPACTAGDVETGEGSIAGCVNPGVQALD